MAGAILTGPLRGWPRWAGHVKPEKEPVNAQPPSLTYTNTQTNTTRHTRILAVHLWPPHLVFDADLVHAEQGQS